LLDLILAEINPTKVMLFGSYVKGLATNQSDMDLAVWAMQFTRFLGLLKSQENN